MKSHTMLKKIVLIASIAILFTISFAAVNAVHAQQATNIVGPFQDRYYARVEKLCTWEEGNRLALTMKPLKDKKRRLYRPTLATMNSFQENAWVYEHLGHPDSYWLGGRQNRNARRPQDGWVWVTTGRAFTYANWGEGEPNDIRRLEDHKEDYLAFSEKGGGQWSDRGGRLPGFVVEYIAD